MKLLILGPGGQLGTDLLDAARARGGDAVGLARSGLDLSRTDSIGPALEGHSFDVLVNCAAHHGTDAIEADPGPAFVVNGRAVGALAAACRERGARLLHMSTDYVFRGDAERPYTEADPPSPVNAYGASKLVGEGLALTEHPANTWIVRTASLFGGSATGSGRGNFVEAILTAAESGRPLRVVTDVVMSPTYTGDLASALLDFLAVAPEPGVYHLTSGGQASWHAFAQAAVSGWGIDRQVERTTTAEQSSAAPRPRFSVLDSSRAAAVGVELPPWEEGLRRYLERRKTVMSRSTGT